MIGLIDVDGHNYPNIALMKISAFYKSVGQDVEWYDPNRERYDRVYMSKVFSDAYTPDIPAPLNADKVIRGGTGYAIETISGKEFYNADKNECLPAHIEAMYPDYSLYPEYTGYDQKLSKQTAFGFLTRGCPRGCQFCIVGNKEGRKARKVADLSQFWNGQGNICLCDPNILACKDCDELLQQLIQSGAKIDFNQGLDARLITPDVAQTLARMNLKTVHFAMDTMEQIESVKRGIKLYVDAVKAIKGKWNWRYAKCFMITNFDTTVEQDLIRIAAIQECECQPYVMIYNKPSAPAVLRRLQRWCNNTMLYASSSTFEEYQGKFYKSVLTNA